MRGFDVESAPLEQPCAGQQECSITEVINAFKQTLTLRRQAHIA